MLQTAHEAYLESRVASAGPVELVKLLYQGASTAVRQARAHLAAGEIAERSRAISKASAMLMELAVSVDRERGGELASRLARLYDYMVRRLTNANLTQADGQLVEVLGLLTTLTEAWEGIDQPVERVEAAAPRFAPWQQSGGVDAETAGHVWSF